ncbi:MAG: recombinase family protein [Oscillospiraceae bacterium]|nr:recombinase family protein [Oscillospiraceae bacterium]
MNYGYARCSTNETKQDINRQVRELKAAGAEEIVVEYEHGDSKIKSQQAAMFDQAAAGDTIIVLEVSRLARSTQQLCEIIERVREKHLRLVIVGSITLDCRNGQADPMSEAFLQMAGVFSQLELAMIRSRVRSGMENARAKGKQIGRPQVSKEDIPATFLRHYPAHKNGQLNISELARVCDISRTTAYKYKALLEA